MLRKLLKYEIKATARTFLPLYALLLIFAVVNRVFLEINSDHLFIPTAVSSTAYGVILIGIFVMTLIVTIQRFHRNLIGDEGYLMFTLPVRPCLHIWSKFLVSFLWSVLSVFTALISVVIMAAEPKFFQVFGKEFMEFIQAMNEVGPHAWLFALEMLAFVLVVSAFFTLKIYGSIMLGSLSPKHKLLVSFGVFVGMGIVEQIIGSMVLVSVSKNSYFGIHFPAHDAVEVLQRAEGVLLGMIVFFLFFATAYYILTDWMMKKKLNLE